MPILRVTVRWSGFIGAPGYSAFHFMGGGGLISDAQQVANRVAGAVQNLVTILPDGVTLTVMPEVEEIDEATGMVTGFQNVTDVPVHEGVADGPYSASSGAVINWRTNDLRFGRRIRGRTFIVPLAGSAYDSEGSLNGTAIDELRNMGDELVGSDLDSELVVWSRPIDGSGGVAATVVAHQVPDMAAVLRSRRD